MEGYTVVHKEGRTYLVKSVEQTEKEMKQYIKKNGKPDYSWTGTNPQLN